MRFLSVLAVTVSRRGSGWALLAGLVLLASGPVSAQGRDPATSVESVLEIPVDIDLAALMTRADALLPREAGHWRGWRRESGFETRYRVWRGPLSLSLMGDLLTVQAHVRYWVQARKRLIGSLDLEAGCGIEEPPRQAVVGMQVRIGWGSDWTIRPRFRILPTRFIDRCEVTALDIDVSPLIGRVFRKRMEAALRDAMRELHPSLDAVRKGAVQHWRALQRPMELTPGIWLEANPLAVGLAPPRGAGQRLQTVLGLVLAPSITVGRGAGVPDRVAGQALPPLQSFFPRGQGLRFDLELELDLADIGTHVLREVVGRELSVEGRSIGIHSLELSGEGSEILVSAGLTGDAEGRIRIWAEPGFDTRRQSLLLKGLDYVYEAEDAGAALLADLFYQRIQTLLEEGANSLLAERSRRISSDLQSALESVLPADLKIDLSRLRVERMGFALGDSTLQLRGAASGLVSVSVR